MRVDGLAQISGCSIYLVPAPELFVFLLIAPSFVYLLPICALARYLTLLPVYYIQSYMCDTCAQFRLLCFLALLIRIGLHTELRTVARPFDISCFSNSYQ